jgi:hypothetical protein
MAAAQSVRQVVVREQTPCPTCRIVFDSIATVGDRDGPGIVENERSWIVRDSRGRHYVFYPYATEFKVFDSTGAYLRTVGRKGGGPGEFDAIAGVRPGPGDSIHVLDWGLSRHSIFSPELSYARGVIIAMQPQMRWVLLPDGRIVLNADVRTPDRIGRPLHLLARDGSLSGSFGAAAAAYQPNVPGLVTRALAVHHRNDSQVWAGHERAYVIDLVDVNSGQILLQVVREVPWFPSGERPQGRRGESADEPPRPRLARVDQSDDGLLWVWTVVPDARWRSAVTPGAGGHIVISDFARYSDYVLEVLDPENGRLVASERFDATAPSLIAGNLAARFVQEDLDYPRFEIYRVRLARD